MKDGKTLTNGGTILLVGPSSTLNVQGALVNDGTIKQHRKLEIGEYGRVTGTGSIVRLPEIEVALSKGGSPISQAAYDDLITVSAVLTAPAAGGSISAGDDVSFYLDNTNGILLKTKRAAVGGSTAAVTFDWKMPQTEKRRPP